MNAGEGSVDMVSGSSERLAPVLTVTHPSPAQETEDHLDPLPTCRTRAKRGGAQKKGKLVSCKVGSFAQRTTAFCVRVPLATADSLPF